MLDFSPTPRRTSTEDKEENKSLPAARYDTRPRPPSSCSTQRNPHRPHLYASPE
ncbi:unnamed protein product, partial [Brassica rapa subsp. trilocularis]